MISRRQFLTRAALAVPLIAAPATLAELLVPRRSIFLPPRGGWPADSGYVFGPGWLWIQKNDEPRVFIGEIDELVLEPGDLLTAGCSVPESPAVSLQLPLIA